MARLDPNQLAIIARGADEIERLRAENAQLAVQARAFDVLAKLMGLLVPSRGEAWGVDPAWMLRDLHAKMLAETDELKADHEHVWVRDGQIERCDYGDCDFVRKPQLGDAGGAVSGQHPASDGSTDAA